MFSGLAYWGLNGKTLFPMVCSTAARSGMRLIKSCSFRTSLQFMCCQVLRKIIPSEQSVLEVIDLPPGMRAFLTNNLSWLLRPCELGQNESGVESLLALSDIEDFIEIERNAPPPAATTTTRRGKRTAAELDTGSGNSSTREPPAKMRRTESQTSSGSPKHSGGKSTTMDCKSEIGANSKQECQDSSIGGTSSEAALCSTSTQLCPDPRSNVTGSGETSTSGPISPVAGEASASDADTAATALESSSDAMDTCIELDADLCSCSTEEQ